MLTGFYTQTSSRRINQSLGRDVTEPGFLRGDNFEDSRSISDFVDLFPTSSRKVSNIGAKFSQLQLGKTLIPCSWCANSPLVIWDHQSTCWKRPVYRPACIPTGEHDAIRCHPGKKRTLDYACCPSVHCLFPSDNWLGGSFYSGSGMLKVSLFWEFWTIYCTQTRTKFTWTIPLEFAKAEIFLTICHCKHI